MVTAARVVCTGVTEGAYDTTACVRARNIATKGECAIADLLRK